MLRKYIMPRNLRGLEPAMVDREEGKERKEDW